MKNYSQDSKLEEQPALTQEMDNQPITHIKSRHYLGAELKDKVAIITGGDSGIGQAVAILYAQYGIKTVIVYYDEDKDAQYTLEQVNSCGSTGMALKGDIQSADFCKKVVSSTMEKYGRVDILINNASVQYPQDDLCNISEDQLLQTFSVNVFGMFYLTQAVIQQMHKGGSIINTSSVTAFRGSEHLVDYAATKAAIIGFTRSMAMQLVKKQIRVNAVAPGPIMTPLIESSFDAEHVSKFGEDTPMGRQGQPIEVAPSYLFLVLDENSYMTGQVLHPNGGEIVS